MLIHRQARRQQIIVGVAIVYSLAASVIAARGVVFGNWLLVVSPFVVLATAILTRLDPYAVLIIIIVEAAFNYAPSLFNPATRRSDLITQIIRDVLLLFLIFRWFTGLIAKRRRIPGLPKELTLPVALWIGYVFLRSIHGDVVSLKEVARLMRHWAIYPLTLMVVTADIVRTDRQRLKLFRALILSGLVVALIAILEGAFGFGNSWYENHHYVFFETGVLLATNTRAISTLLSPNNLSAFLSLLIIVIVDLHAHGVLDRVIPARLAYLTAVCALFAMAYCVSRGPALGLLAISPLLLRGYRGRRLHMRRGRVLLGLSVVIGMVLILHNSNALRAASLMENPRVVTLTSTLLKMFQSPFELLFGYGVGHGAAYLSGVINAEMVSSDMWLVIVFGYTGIIGLILFFYYFGSMVKTLQRIEQQHIDPLSRATCRVGFLYLWFAFFWGFGAVSFNLFPLSFYLWILVGTGLATSQEIHSAGRSSALTSAEGGLK